MDLPATADDALAQPTRARLFAVLNELRRPAGTEELARALDLHPNGVRVHLEQLHAAGLVSRAKSPSARGRPRDDWSVAAGAQPGGDPPNAYGDLVRWLARAIPARQSRLRDVESAGREIGRELAPDGSFSAHDAMRTALATLGFQPELDVAGNGTLTCTLRNCPYRNAVKENQEVVCTLHRGITRGLLDVIAPKATMTGFVPKDPEPAGCLIEVKGLDRPTPTAENAT